MIGSEPEDRLLFFQELLSQGIDRPLFFQKYCLEARTGAPFVQKSCREAQMGLLDKKKCNGASVWATFGLQTGDFYTLYNVRAM